MHVCIGIYTRRHTVVVVVVEGGVIGVEFGVGVENDVVLQLLQAIA
jgi:hypothetical protein